MAGGEGTATCPCAPAGGRGRSRAWSCEDMWPQTLVSCCVPGPGDPSVAGPRPPAPCTHGLGRPGLERPGVRLSRTMSMRVSQPEAVEASVVLSTAIFLKPMWQPGSRCRRGTRRAGAGLRARVAHAHFHKEETCHSAVMPWNNVLLFFLSFFF